MAYLWPLITHLMSLKRTIYNYWNKLRFALRVSHDLSSFLQLLMQSKIYNQAYNARQLDKIPKKIMQYHVRLNNDQQVIHMRTYAGDLFVFYEVFLYEVYHIPQRYLSRVNVIVDLGAHIGFTSLYFAYKYPNARIISVEASPKNFALLDNNVQSVERIQAIHCAAYIEDAILSFNDDGLAHNNKLDTHGSIEIKGVSMPTLMSECNIEQIDLLKIDIEGAEALLLSHNTSWLDNVRCIIIEIHSPYTLSDLKRDLEKYHFRIVDTDENSQVKNIVAFKL